MSFLQEISQYQDILFPYLSNIGNSGHNVLQIFRGEEYGSKEEITGYRT